MHCNIHFKKPHLRDYYKRELNIMPDSKPDKGGTLKIGRLGRSPSHARYNQEGRRDKNKKRKAAKQARKELRQRREAIKR